MLSTNYYFASCALEYFSHTTDDSGFYSMNLSLYFPSQESFAAGHQIIWNTCQKLFYRLDFWEGQVSFSRILCYRASNTLKLPPKNILQTIITNNYCLFQSGFGDIATECKATLQLRQLSTRDRAARQCRQALQRSLKVWDLLQLERRFW